MLQKMCRKYLKRLLPAAKEVGLEEFVVTTINKNKSGTCVATRQQVDMLASMCEDNRVKREEIPNIVGKSYRFCLTGNLFKRIRKFKDKGLYQKECDNIYCLPRQRKDEESVSFRVVEKEHISTVQDCELAVRVTEEKAIEAAKEMIVDVFNEVHGINQTMYLEDFVARLKK